MTTIAIHQPNYLPWLGYFDKMAKSDIFVIFDDVQLPMGGHSYETRTIISSGNGPLTLNIPVENRGRHPIKDTKLAAGRWRDKHLKSLALSYGKSSLFHLLAEIYRRDWKMLLDFNLELICLVADWLEVAPEIILSSSLKVPGIGTEKILGIIKALGGDTYVSGTGNGSRRYVNEETFAANNIKLVWHSYSGPNLSAIDSLLGRTEWQSPLSTPRAAISF